MYKMNQLGAHYFLVYLFLTSTCFGQLCAHHQKNLLYLCDTGIFHCLWVAVWSAAAPIQKLGAENHMLQLNI